MGEVSTNDLLETRKTIVDIIRKEMLGPGSEFPLPDLEHELISTSPISRYSVGILYPQGNKVDLDNEDSTPKTSEDADEKSDTPNTAITPSEIKVENDVKPVSSDDFSGDCMDEEVNMASQYMPSSMGFTFTISKDVSKIVGHINFGTYKSKKLATDCVVPFVPYNKDSFSLPGSFSVLFQYDKESEILSLKKPVSRKELNALLEKDTLPEADASDLKRRFYHLVDCYENGNLREPHDLDFTLNFNTGNYSNEPSNNNIDGTHLKITALKTPLKGGLFSITIMAINNCENEKPSGSNCIFQPILSVSSSSNDFVFKESRLNADFYTMDEEEQSLELLYRNKKNYATGLGVSTNWDIDENGSGSIWTDYMPTSEVPSMDFGLPQNSDISSRNLSMKFFSDLNDNPKSEKLSVARKLVDLYSNWIDGLKEDASSLEDKYKKAAAKNIASCEDARNRMLKGISTLESNELAYNSFLLANRAMFMQRVHLKMQDDNKSEDCLPGNPKILSQIQQMNYKEIDDDKTVKCWWRPFQLAFILLNIDSIVNEESAERNLVDLIWFPTGGGKTEAYLGLSAFTIFYRKLAHPEQSAGTAIIMRYTLRLLTAQQFTRASTLICACEYIRKDCISSLPRYPRYNLGMEPITIGLWIGGSHIPNKTSDAKLYLEKLQKATHAFAANDNNKFQVLKCPWCGTKLVKEFNRSGSVGSWGYAIRLGKQFYLHCTNQKCHFFQELPIQIIDEELYKKPPTLLFGTVDKFAMMTWTEDTGSFFASNSNNRPPELIIQDELHLISGSLGTIVGLFESAVDALCSQKGVSPKIIASTATIRRASEQCSNLYNRKVIQFPAPGLNADDSFFAKERPINYPSLDYGRIYVGIMPAGKTKVMTEVRLLSAMLQRIYSLDVDSDIKDLYWTIAAYYSSLKDLGKASTLVGDDVKDFIIRIGNRLIERKRSILKVRELTSRVSTTELNTSLDDLEKNTYTGDDGKYPTSLVLATNMISVGIDVARLNTMYMLGQPKLTSEYIQASSRVGRSFPGVIFVQYDATKSRDRSHYESFKSYHDSFYKYVEPTGVTPFSAPARDRALHSAIIAIVRQLEPDLSAEKSAINFDKTKYASLINDIKIFFTERVQSINSRDSSGAKTDPTEVEKEINSFFDDWDTIARSCRNESPSIGLYYGKTDMMDLRKPEGRRRLLTTFESGKNDGIRRTQTSMRSVDSSVTGKIIIEGEEE